MELTEELKELLKAHELACVADFIDKEEEDTYLENTDLNLDCIKFISKKYEGYSCGRLEEKIVNKLKDFI